MQADREFAERLEIFFGAASEAVCRVYARLDLLDGDASLRLGGTLTGPTCAYSQTLQATFQFIDRGPGRSLLAEAVVPEPCFWTPELPHVYRADVELRHGDEPLARVERTVGIRRLGAAGRNLVYGGKGWVLRAVSAGELLRGELSCFHDFDTAMHARSPDQAVCEAASRVGVLLVAELEAPDLRDLRRLVRWPAIGVIALPAAEPSTLRQLGHNAVLAQRVVVGTPLRPADWAEAVICELPAGEQLPTSYADCPLPIIIHCPAGAIDSVAKGRAACDRLQRELAPIGQFAGYII